MIVWIAVVSLALVVASGAPGLDKIPAPHECDGVVRYNLTFEGLWSEELFPKQYPQFRPNAQWSKLVGRSHSGQYYIWHLDEVATAPLKLFAEKGNSEEFDTEAQGHLHVLDAFYGGPILQGVGSKWTTFFVDSDHSKVSFATKIVPSPDWFVGIDSLELCDPSNGDWIEEMTFNLGPMDAGTDKGFTFSSPNWQDIPLKPIFKITSQFPSHPANSFYYPGLEELPPMARVTLKLMKTYIDEQWFYTEYQTEDSDDETEDEEMLSEHKEVRDEEHISEKSEEINEPHSQEPTLIEVENFSTQTDSTVLYTSKPRKASYAKENTHKMTTPTTSETTTTTTSTTKPTSTTKDWYMYYKRFTTTRRTQPTTTTEPEVTENLENYKREPESIHNQIGYYGRLNQQQQFQHYGGPTMCPQEEWTDWSACSVTCGYGEMTRYRNVPTTNEFGGLECVKEQEQQFCGSLRNCYKFKKFNFDNWGIN